MSKQLFFVTCSSQQDAVDYNFTGHMPSLFSLCSREVKEMLIYEEVLKSSGLQNNFSLKLLRSVRQSIEELLTVWWSLSMSERINDLTTDKPAFYELTKFRYLLGKQIIHQPTFVT